MLVEALVTQSTVEAFDKPFCIWFYATWSRGVSRLLVRLFNPARSAIRKLAG